MGGLGFWEVIILAGAAGVVAIIVVVVAIVAVINASRK
jgi:hypothetical protein